MTFPTLLVILLLSVFAAPRIGHFVSDQSVCECFLSCPPPLR